MTTPLRRLKDDPDFLWETGCDLADEAFSTGGYDLPAMRANVLSATQGPSAGAPLRTASSSWPWFAGVVFAALAAMGGGLWSVSGPSGGAEGERPVAAEGASAVAASVSPVFEAEREEPSAEVVKVELAPLSAEGVHEPAVAEPVGAVERQVADPQDVVLPPQDGVVDVEVDAPEQPSSLAIELSAYDMANDQLASGSFASAATGFSAYLRGYPSGRLRAESQMGLLHALVGVGDGEAVEAQAAAIADLPSLAGKRDEILRMRAENLVRLQRCDDAQQVAQHLSGRDAANIRRACRWKE